MLVIIILYEIYIMTLSQSTTDNFRVRFSPQQLDYCREWNYYFFALHIWLSVPKLNSLYKDQLLSGFNKYKSKNGFDK